MLYADNDKRVDKRRKNYLFLGSIYAHGDLHKVLGHDQLNTDSIELFNDIFNCFHENDKFERFHKATDSKGVIYNVYMFLWKNKKIGKWIGLVCLAGDSESIEDAKEKYEKGVTDL